MRGFIFRKHFFPPLTHTRSTLGIAVKGKNSTYNEQRSKLFFFHWLLLCKLNKSRDLVDTDPQVKRIAFTKNMGNLAVGLQLPTTASGMFRGDYKTRL